MRKVPRSGLEADGPISMTSASVLTRARGLGPGRVAGPDRWGPAPLVDAGRAQESFVDDRGVEKRAKAEGEGGEAGGDEPAIGRGLGSLDIEVERLRVEALGKIDDGRL